MRYDLPRGIIALLFVAFFATTLFNPFGHLDLPPQQQTHEQPIQEHIIHDELFNTKLNELKNKDVPLTVETWSQKQTHYTAERGNVKIALDNHTIKTIHLNGIQNPERATLRLDEPIIEDALQAYVIDPTGLDFVNGSATIVAKGNTLLKCPTWDYERQTCPVVCASTNSSENDSCIQWIHLQDIIPGEEYTVALSPEDPGFIELNVSEATGEQSTTSTTFVNLTTTEFTTNNNQWLFLGYGEVAGTVDTSDVRVRLVRHTSGTTTVAARQRWQPDTVPATFPPGDYTTFFGGNLRTLPPATRQLTMQFASEAVAQTTSVRRARAIALRVDDNDGLRTPVGNAGLNTITPANTWVTNGTLLFTPNQTQDYLILSYAQVRPESTTESVGARLQQNGAVIGRMFREGETVDDERLFATHRLITAPKNVQQNFTLQFFSETTAGKTYRRARLLAIPIDRAFTNESNTDSSITAPGQQNKLNLTFNTTRPLTRAIIIGSADITLASAFNGDFILAELTLNGTTIGNMTLGLSDATDNVSFIVASQENLTAGTHTLGLNYNMIEGVGPNTLTISNARITAIIPNEPPISNNVQLVSEFGTNTTTEDLTVTSSITDNDGDPTTHINDFRVNGTSITALHMPFEGTDGTEASFAKDYSTNGNNATFINATYLPTGGHDNNGAYDFDGTTTVQIADNPSLDLTGPLTLEARINPDTFVALAPILDKPTPTFVAPFLMYALTFGSTNNFGMRLASGGVTFFCESAANSLSLNNWQHVVGRWNGTDIQLFVNGTASGAPCAFAGPIDTNNEDVYIGYYPPSAAFSFDGQFDEVHIYNRSLSDDQILKYYTDNDELSFEETRIGDTWEVCQTPNDGIEDGTEVCSNTITIAEGLDVAVDADQDTYIHGQQATIAINTTDGQGSPRSANVTTDIIYGNLSTPFGTPWWNLSYPRRLPITITNNQGSTLSNFIVNLTIDTETLIDAGTLKANCADIRFARFRQNTQEELSYLVDQGTCNSNETNIWVLLPSLQGSGNTTVFMYYNNASVNSASTESIFNQTATVTQYVLSSVLAGEPLNVISFVDNNTISTGSNSFTIDRGEYGTFTAAQLTSSTVITGTGPFDTGFNDTTTGNAQNGGKATPLAFAGKQFAYRNDRGNPDFPIVAPFADTAVEVFNGGTSVLNTTLTQGVPTELTGFSITVGNAAIIEADNPVVVSHEDGSTNNRDFFPLYPAGTDWWGVPSANLEIGSAEDNVNITILDSTGGNTSITLDRGQATELTGLGTEGSTAAYHVIANGSINVFQIADSDGTDATVFLPETELATEYFLPLSAQYIAIAATQPSTNCTTIEPDGTQTSLTSGSNARPFPNKIFFGTAADTLNFDVGTRLICDAPVYAYIEFLNTGQVGAETNLLNIKASRQITSPSPTSITFGREQHILRDINETDVNGAYDLLFNTSGQFIGNYTAVTLGETDGVKDTGSDSFEIINDNSPPNVTDLRPVSNSTFNASDVIEIAANVTDDVGVASVIANISRPDLTNDIVTLFLAGGDKYNNSYTIPALLGQYNVTFIATDVNGLVNNTETTFFVSDDNSPPDVFDLRPIENSTYNVTQTIEIAANVTDNLAVDVVYANITYPNGTVQQVTLNRVTPVFETGTIQTNGWTTVTSPHTYTNPVVVARPREGFETSADNEIATAIITNITTNSFRVQLRNESTTIPGSVSYIIAETGSHTLPNGMLLQAGRVTVSNYDADGESATSWNTITYPTAYASAPAILASPNNDSAQDWVSVRYDSGTLTTTGVDLSLEIDQTYGTAPVAASGVGNGENNTIGWIAINRTSTGIIEGALEPAVDEDPSTSDFRTITFTTPFTSAPAYFPTQEESGGTDPSTVSITNLSSTDVEIRLAEERTDGEQVHATEDVIWAAFAVNLNNPNQKFNASFTIPGLTGLYNVSFFANDTQNNINDTERTNFTTVDLVAPTIVFDLFRATINATTNTTTLNETTLRQIERFIVIYNITDNVDVDRIRLFFRNTNGSILDSCQGTLNSSIGTIGNTQYTNCFEWLEFDNTTDTSTLSRDTFLGEGVIFTRPGPNQYEWDIDDINKPIIKNYPFNGSTAHFNDSFKIYGNNSLRVYLPAPIPLDADIYSSNINFNFTPGVTNSIKAYMCNRLFPDGKPATQSGNCTLLDEKFPNEFQDTEISFYASNISLPIVGNSLENASLVFIQPDETNPANYYYPLMVNVFNASLQNVTSFSDDGHVTHNFTFPLSSDADVHWFYEGTTCFQFFAVANDTSDNEFNSSIEEFCWQNFGDNFPPSNPQIITPETDQIVSGLFNITWEDSIDADGDAFNLSVFLHNTDGTLNQTLAVNITEGTEYYEWNTTTVPDGLYKINITAIDTFGAQSDGALTGNFTVDNTPPVITLGVCQPQFVNTPVAVTCNATITDALAGLDAVLANLTFPNGTTVNQPLNVSGNEYSFTRTATLPNRYKVIWYANDTAKDTVNNQIQVVQTFREGTPPNITIIHPLGQLIEDGTSVALTINATDSDGISNVTANVTLPNGTVRFIPSGQKDTLFGTDAPSDNFDTDTENINWEIQTDTELGQTCTRDIDSTEPGKAHLSISGAASLKTSTSCTYESIREVDGDFNVTIDYTINELQTSSSISLGMIEEATQSVFISELASITIANVTGGGRLQLGINDNGSLNLFHIEDLNPIPINGKFSIVRDNNNFSYYFHNGTTWRLINSTLANINRGLHIRFGSTNFFAEYGTANASWDNLTVDSDNFTFATFVETLQPGQYNVTFIVNDTLGAVNDTEMTNFTIFEFNNKPSTPLIILPARNQVINGQFNISWVQVIDEENDTLEYNITLLNPNYSFNSTIINNLPNNRTVYEWNTTTVPDGFYNMRVEVFENNTPAGKSNSDITNGFFIVDNTPPVITLGACAPENANTPVNVTCNATITDVTSGLASVIVNITLPNGTIIQPTLNVTGSQYNFTITAEEPGTYNALWIATDNGGLQTTANQQFREGSPPNVTIIHPLGQTFNDGAVVALTVNATDSDGISNVTANLTYPNGTTILITQGPRFDQFGQSTPSDNFDTDSINTIWTAQGIFEGGQTCTQDIDTTIPDQLYLNLTGAATFSPFGTCGISSIRGLEGDFNLTITWNVLTPELALDTALTVGFSEQNTFSFANRQALFVISNSTGPGTVLSIYENDDGVTNLSSQQPVTNVTFGIARIERINNTFNAYAFNGTDFVFVNTTTTSISQSLHVQLGVVNFAPNYGDVAVAVDNLTIDDFQNYTFANFEDTQQIGTYNVTFIVNDTFNAINDTEMTNFTIIDFNQPPSTPLIILPLPNQAINGQFNITWITVVDDENDTLEYNITLLNPNFTVNSSIITELANTPFPRTIYEWNTTTVPDGTYSMLLQVYENETVDGKSNSDTIDGTFIVDNTNPLVANITPVPGTNITQNNSINITADVTDNLAGVASVQATITLPNGTMQTFTMSLNASPGYYVTFNNTQLLGQYNVTIIATDNAGNVNNTETTFFITQAAAGPQITDFRPFLDTRFLLNQSPVYTSAIIKDPNNLPFNVSANITLPNGTINALPIKNDAYQLDDDTLFILKLDEQNGTPNVTSNHNFQAHISGTTFLTQGVPGKFDNAIFFNGASGLITISNNGILNFNATENFTVEAWISSTFLGGDEDIINKFNPGNLSVPGWEFHLLSTGEVQLELHAGNLSNYGVTSTTQVHDIGFVHVAATRDATNEECKLYINGTLENTTYCPAFDLSNSFNLSIGNHIDLSEPFLGEIDDVRLSSVVRTGFSPDYYVAPWTNLLLRGDYTVTLAANDTQNIFTTTNTTFKRIPLDVIDILDINSNFRSFNTTVTSNISGTLNLSIETNLTRYETINITNYNDTGHFTILTIDDNNIRSPISNQYVLDPTNMDTDTITITVNSSATGELYKCPDYILANSTCPSDFTILQNITTDELYTVTFNTTDPAFLETSAAVDIALAPINNTAFVIAFIDPVESDFSFQIRGTDGSTIVNTTDLDTSADLTSRISVDIINSTHFVALWADGPINDLKIALITLNGTIRAGPTTIDTNIGTNTDVSVQMLNGSVAVFCNANDADNDADYRIVDINPPASPIVGESNVDGNIAPGGTLQNLIECAGNNASRWTYFWFDDAGFLFFGNDATYEVLDSTGATLAGPTDIDFNIGETGQVAATDLNNNATALFWYDSTDDDTTYAIVDLTGTTIAGPTDLDTTAPILSRVSTATIRENITATDDYFVAMWSDAADIAIKAAIIRNDGSIYTPEFNISTEPNVTALLHDVTARDTISNQSICPGKFIAALSNSSGTGEFLRFHLNGTSWNGICADLVPIDITFNNTFPGENETIEINATILNNGTINLTDVTVQFYDGLCGSGTQINGDITIPFIAEKETRTVNVSYIANPVGPHNISVCVDPLNTIVEDNETNNNLTVVLNVSSTQRFFGNLGGNVTLDDNLNRTEYDWAFDDAGNVYIADIDSNISFPDLQALTRTTAGALAANDCLDADRNLGSNGFNDSIQALWCTDASNPAETSSFFSFDRTINNVPVINSSNSTDYLTGILWDTSDDTGNGQYDIVDKEDLVFISNINQSTLTPKGVVDYLIRVPVLLRAYNTSIDRVNLYVELR